jgi:hypothetical protein
MTLSDCIAKEIKTYFPTIKTYLITRYANKYTSAVLSELRASIIRTNPLLEREDELAFNADSVRYLCGRVGGGNAWLYHILVANIRTALVIEQFKGNIGRLSRVKINPIYKEMIMEELLNTPTTRLTDRERRELDQKANRIIPVDPTSLSSFIEHTKDNLKTCAPGTYRDKLIENLVLAQDLYFNITDDNTIREYWETADTGREYGHYNSLQRVPQVVRHAALGPCWKYDFQAHSFAVLASLAHAMDPDLKIASVVDYVKNRSQIRQRIARQVGVREQAIKQVFTSLGFGARPINNPYTAIRNAVYTEDNYNRLMACTEFQYINQDLDAIRKTILEHEHFQGDFTWFLGLQFNSKKPNGHKKTPSQRLAWIYQNTEAYTIQRFIEIVEQQTALRPLLTVHDGVYYKQPIPVSVMIDAQVILREEIHYVRVEQQAIWPISTDQTHDTRFKADDDHIAEHRARIAQEEQLARGYKSDLIAGSMATPRPVTIDPDAVEKEQLGLYTGANHQARAWTGDEHYDADTDPFFEDMTRQERKEYQQAREAILGKQPDTSRPDSIRQLLERN